MNTFAPSLSPTSNTPIQKRPDIETLIKVKIPPLEGTILKLAELLRDMNVSTRQIADAVGCDPVLAARVLRLANSSFYCRLSTHTSLLKAIDAIGTKSIYDMVMLGAMSDRFAKEIGNTVVGRTIWQHSIAVGLVAREISHELGLRGVEEAFACGLLHDIGKILLFSADPDVFSAMQEQKNEQEMMAAEESAYGFNHATLGGHLGQKWRIPDSICSVIIHHHNPARSTISTVMAHIVNAADFITNSHGYGLRHDPNVSIFESNSIQYLNLTMENINNVWERIHDPLAEVIGTFR